MDEHKNLIPDEELPAFTLEDILREFGSQHDDGRLHDDAAPELLEDLPLLELVVDAPLSEPSGDREEPDLPVWTPAPRQAEPAAPVSSDTIRVDAALIRDNADRPAVSGDTQPFTPLGEQPPSVTGPAVGEAEPFSANWEPQYDQPISDYVPPEPIVFRPRSRLGELKRKLMEGPEQRYNALSERGVGKLQIALFVCMLIVVLACACVVLHRMNMVRENRMRLLVFGELFAMLLCATLCWERLAQGLGCIFRGRFTPDTLLAFTFAACIADGVFCLQEVTVPFCAAFCLEVLMCLWAEYQRRSTELCQMDTLRKATRLNRISKAPACYEDRPGFFVSEGQPEDFMDSYQTPSAPERAINRFALLGLALSVAVSAAAGIHGGLRVGIRTWSAAILAVCPATMLICQTRPCWALQRRLHRFGAVLCGWQGVKAAAGSAVVPLRDEDLLPGGSVKINGVKFSPGRDPDTIIAYATAVMTASGSCLAPLFEHMHKTRRAQRYELDEFKNYDGKGCGALICGEQVLLGSLEFLKNMGVEIPAGTRVSQAVYISIEGEFCGCFALAFGKLKGVSAGLSALCTQRKLTAVLSSSNFVLNEEFIHSKYQVDTRRMAFPSFSERERLSAWQPAEQQSPPIALTTQDGLAGAAFSITGARSLRIASTAGAIVHILGGLVGLAAVLILTLTGRTDLMTPMNLLLLELIWAIPGLMISDWTRNL